MIEGLITRDWVGTFIAIGDIIADPTSNLAAALLIFGGALLVIVILIVVALMSLFRAAGPPAASGDDEWEETEEAEWAEPTTEWSEADEAAWVAAETARVEAEAAAAGAAKKARRIRVSAVVAVLLVAGWLATGVIMALPSTCASCHAKNIHSANRATDPHRGSDCLTCHGSSTYASAITLGMPVSALHVSWGSTGRQRVFFGRVGTGACLACHSGDIAGTVEIRAKAVKVSHAAPLAAGAECLDCHRMTDGVVGPSTTKMSPCLRCHDGTKASADCRYCHTGDVGLAIAGRGRPSPKTAERLIETPDCGGCHAQTECDACHGVRLPHTPQFMAYAHARQGVEDIWSNGGRTCGKCHNARSRPCTKCHAGAFPSHGTSFKAIHGASGGTGTGCDTCHVEMAYRQGRRFCIDLCHTDRKQ